MPDADFQLRLRRFEIPGRVSIIEGNGEMPKIEVATDWSRAEVYLHGAHVTDFQKNGEPPLLFLSQCSRFEAGQPIRGGVPVIFPWFGAREGEAMHGFARTADWALHETVTVPDGGVSLRFSLPETVEGAVIPSCSANLVVTVTDTLAMELIVTNLAPDQPLVYEECLHTYFAVGDIGAVSVAGLKGAAYLDKVDNYARKTETADAIQIASEVDRIYLDTAAAVDIADAKWKRRIRVEKTGSASTVVWNPWIAKGQQMPDFGNEEYRQMLCVESGNVTKNKVTLAPGRSHVMTVRIGSAPF